jgi:hypothetical protein
MRSFFTAGRPSGDREGGRWRRGWRQRYFFRCHASRCVTPDETV